jgi:phosphoribosylamine--glycine ligase/phosphoribosylformylglycinamidine cyclo-ligase
MESIRILLVGSGGREHAIAWKLSQSSKVSHIYVCPGNGGTAALNKTTNLSSISASDFPSLVQFAKEQSINLLIPGPEQPLVDGIVDVFRSQAPEVPCFGPSKKAAEMEGSKTFAKDFMARHNIPTAAYANFSSYEPAKAYLDSVSHAVVIKASGLAAGKGVIISLSKEEAHAALKEIMLERQFGAAGDEVVIEEFLEGDEISILSFCDGETIRSLPPAQDHKRIFDGDRGPNTGGMGTYAPAPERICSAAMFEDIERTVLRPTVEGMRKEGMPFVGCLFTGFMITKNGPKVLEYNVRFGDPETQSLLQLMENDLVDVMLACTDGKLKDVELRIKIAAAATVVVAAAGYPESYKKGTPMRLDNTAEDVVLFHAGTTLDESTTPPVLRTSGGRVIASTATAAKLEDAIKKAYEGVNCIHFEGMQYRKDIGVRALR